MSKPSDYVAEMLHKLREDISGIKHRLFTEKSTSASIEVPHYTIDAKHEDGQSREKDDKAIRATLNLPPTIRIDAQTEERHKPWHKDRSVWLQLVTIAVGIVVATIYGWQLKQMIDSNKLTRKVLQLQYSQSRSSVQITTNSFYKETADDIKKAGMITIELQNVGKATASKVRGTVVAQFLPSSQEPDLDAVGYITKFTNPPLFTGAQPSAVGLILVYKYGTIAQVPPDVWHGLETGTWYVVVFGRVEYVDNFGEWWTQFCAWRPFFKTENPPHIIGFSASKCVDYNIDGGTPNKQ
jgi:hypothetical protein